MDKISKVSFLSSTLKNKKKSVTKRAGLIFPVRRVYTTLKTGNFASRIGIGAAIYITAVLEYLSFEILELSRHAAQQNQRKRILPRHIQLAVQNDDELAVLLKDVIISQGGVKPRIEPELLPKKATSKNYTSKNHQDTSSQEY